MMKVNGAGRMGSGVWSNVITRCIFLSRIDGAWLKAVNKRQQREEVRAYRV
jgi:hypothetical protein